MSFSSKIEGLAATGGGPKAALYTSLGRFKATWPLAAASI
jgi:hypothetical protein